MDVYWLEQSQIQMSGEDDWLSMSELRFLGGLRFAQRRAHWRLGRWTAKRALAMCLDLPDSPATLAKIELRPRASGAPEAFFENRLAGRTASLSHRSGRAICAVAEAGAELGCDLELIEPRSGAFLADYFTPPEQGLVARERIAERPRILTALWSAKESALKALHAGLRLDTRGVIVSLANAPSDGEGWSSLQVRCNGGRIFEGWWQSAGGMVRTLVASPAPGVPIDLLERYDRFTAWIERA
jgi:4'-phosphopantetheinyl transferase